MKKTIHKFFLSLLCLSLLALSTHAQSIEQAKTMRNSKLFKKAMSLANKENYKQAIQTFKLLLQKDPKHLDALFNIGLCYLNTSNAADTAVICFNKGLDILTADEKEGYLGRELGLSLGKAYQVLLKPLKAIAIYETLIEYSEADESAFINEIEREMQICHHANFFINNPIDINVENMGSAVNSMYDDHSPLIAVSETRLFFTSRRNWIKLSMLPDGQYAEKIYTVPLAANNWESARLLKVFFKQNEHEAAASLSPDGNEIVLFRNDEHGKSLYRSHYSGKTWSQPEKFPFPINSYSEETHGSISADKSTFFFTSDREGGLGGLDIYMVKKLPNGKWGQPRNLGSNINTEFDEETPMIHYDGRTLYFSSEGHNTMGRLDVFYSQMNADSTWEFPVNMGYPINTPDDDFFFVPTINKSHAYYASSKFADNYGGSDIYHVKFDANSETELAVIEGEIDNNLGTNYETMRVLVTRTKDNMLVGDYRPSPSTGKYMMFLENGFEYEVKQTNLKKEEKVAFVNITDDLNYIKTRMPVAFSDVAMDAPLIKLISTTPISINPEVKQDKIKQNEPITILPKVDTDKDAIATKIKDNGKLAQQSPKKSIKPKKTLPQNMENVKRFMNEKESSSKNARQIKRYTIQLLALREKPLQDLNFFIDRKITKIEVHLCKDGFTRYTTGEFESYKACLQLKKELTKDKALKDVWIRPIRDFAYLAIKK